MNFMPLMIDLTVITADTVDPDFAADRRYGQIPWLNNFANYKRSVTIRIFYEFKNHVSIFSFESRFGHVTLGNDMRLCGNRHMLDGNGLEFAGSDPGFKKIFISR